MTDREKYLKLKADRDALVLRLTDIPRERATLVEAATPLAEQAIRADVLGEGQTTALKSAVQKNAEATNRLSAELEDGKQRLKVINDVLREYAEKARTELALPNVRRFKAALSDFVSALRHAADAEREAFAVRESVREAFDEIDAPCPADAWRPLVLRDFGSAALQPQIEAFLDHLKSVYGIEV
jgi:hypothetical protein